VFSINTNLGAMAALQSLQSTNAQLTETQNEVSTGQKISSSANNPAVYAITQSMDANISGLSAVQDGLSFGAQVVSTASTSASSISSALQTLTQTITQGQQQGLSSDQMNQSINAVLSQIDTFANSATFNGVNLLAGSTGNGVSSTSLTVLSDTQGNSFTVGGNGAQALNATSAGLGLSGLSVSQTALQLSIGANDATLAFSGTGATAATVTLQTGNYGSSSATAQNPGQKWVFVLNDGTGSTGIDAALNGVKAGIAGAAGTVFTDGTAGAGNLGSDTVTAGSTGGSVTSLSGGNAKYTYVTAQDALGNATQQVNVVSVNIAGLTAAAGAANETDHQSIVNDLVNAMNQVGFNASADASNNLTIAGNNLDTTAATNATALSPVAYGAGGVTTGAQLVGAQAAIATVDGAVTKLGTMSSDLGSATNQITGMQSFTSSLSSALTAGVGALTDADLATESAKLTSLQTKQQLAIQALSIANQQPQTLLSLFK
jgi:flagellin